MLAKRYYVIFVFYNLLLKCRGLEKISTDQDNTILNTESIIRNITNKLFNTIHIKGVKSNQRIKQLAITHNFMTSVTLRDHKVHNSIAKLSRVDKNVNNETHNLVNIINDILNEEPNDIEPISSNEDVVEYVGGFLTKLKGFKHKAGYNDSSNELDINADVLRILEDNIRANNGTSTSKEDDILIDNDFWVPEHQTRRIFKGERTRIKYFPFMASVLIFNGFHCAGSIIKSDLIITAASCLQLAWNNRFYRENPAFLSVRVGSNFYNGGGEVIPVLEVYFHPDYNPKNLRHNICILRLLRKLKFRKKRRGKVKRIEIDRNESPLPMTADGVVIVGWGATGSSNIVKNAWINRLAFAVLDVYHLQECQEIYSREYVTRTNFCAGFISKGGGACNRDVGGPGVVNGILTGVVSFGSPACGTPDAPTVFTKLGYYAAWIDDVMDMEVPHIRKRTTLQTTPYRHIYTTTPLPHVFPKLKMQPLTDWKPKPITELDNLRMLEDEDLFKEFLNTMFSSKEAKDYADMLNDIAVENAQDVNVNKMARDNEMYEDINDDKDRHVKDFTKGFARELYDNDEEMMPEVKETTANDNLKITERDINESIEKIKNYKEVGKKKNKKANFNEPIKKIQNINEIAKKKNVKPKIGKEISKKILKIQPKKKKNVKAVVNDKVKQKNDDVVTLLYISDEDNTKIDDIGSIIEDFDENINDGMTIPLDGFKDLTFRNNNSNYMLNLMSQSELYDFLDEAVRDEGN